MHRLRLQGRPGLPRTNRSVRQLQAARHGVRIASDDAMHVRASRTGMRARGIDAGREGHGALPPQRRVYPTLIGVGVIDENGEGPGCG